MKIRRTHHPWNILEPYDWQKFQPHLHEFMPIFAGISPCLPVPKKKAGCADSQSNGLGPRAEAVKIGPTRDLHWGCLALAASRNDDTASIKWCDPQEIIDDIHRHPQFKWVEFLRYTLRYTSNYLAWLINQISTNRPGTWENWHPVVAKTVGTPNEQIHHDSILNRYFQLFSLLFRWQKIQWAQYVH